MIIRNIRSGHPEQFFVDIEEPLLLRIIITEMGHSAVVQNGCDALFFLELQRAYLHSKLHITS